MEWLGFAHHLLKTDYARNFYPPLKKFKTWSIPLTLMVLLFIGSCKKELLTNEAPNGELLHKAQLFYNQHSNTSTGLKDIKLATTTAIAGNRQKVAKFPPLWDKATTARTATGVSVISVPLAKFKLSNNELDYERRVVFEEEDGEVTGGRITEVFAAPAAIKADGSALAIGSADPKSAGFSGSIIDYDLAYKQARGRLYKNGQQAKGEVSVLPMPKGGFKALQPLGNKRSGSAKGGQSIAMGPDNAISGFEPEFEDGEQNCDNIYLAYIEKDEYGNITFVEVLQFLYRICTGGPVGQQPPGGTSILVDCAEKVNGTAYINTDCQTCMGGTTGIMACPPSEEQIEDALENKPFALFDSIDCQTLKKWLAVAKFTPPQSVLDDLGHLTALATNQGFYTLKMANIQKLADAHSTIVNMDYFSVTITELPIVNGQRLGPGQFLNYIRTNINSFTGGTEQFNPYNANGLDDRAKWSSTNTLGAIIAIDLPNVPDNGSVITSYSSTDRWTFTTIHEPMYGDHPVSGNRDFGYTANQNGSYTFYTRGVDRLTSWDSSFLQSRTGIPFSQADALWTTFQNSISNFVQSHQGNANVNLKEILRPDWQKVKDVIEGKKPLSTLSKNCPD